MVEWVRGMIFYFWDFVSAFETAFFGSVGCVASNVVASEGQRLLVSLYNRPRMSSVKSSPLVFFGCVFPISRFFVASEGVNILACRVVAGVMTMAGQDGAAKWCREPEFLGRCAARLQEMMEDPKVGWSRRRFGPSHTKIEHAADDGHGRQY